MKRALISVSDKTGIVEFAEKILELGYEIISTGGTAKALEYAGIKVINISDVTGFPECLDGRVKTLHPNIHAGLLAIRSSEEHMKQIKELNIDTIDLVVVNLYPFKETILKDNVELEEAIENIDIGGPTMLRAAAKITDVIVIVDPKDYKMVLTELNKEIYQKQRDFIYLLKYLRYSEAMILLLLITLESKEEMMVSQILSLTFEKVQEMRYGENPHQKQLFIRK